MSEDALKKTRKTTRRKAAVIEGNKELIDSLDAIEKEKDIKKEVILSTLENALLQACKEQYKTADNIKVVINRENGAVHVYQEKTVADVVENPVLQISKAIADEKEPSVPHEEGDVVQLEVTPKNFGRIAAQKAKQVVIQKIHEEERRVLFEQFEAKERDIITGVVQRYSGADVYLDLGKVDAVLTAANQIPGESYRLTERIKVYLSKVEQTTKGPRVTVTRAHQDFVKRLFEEEVTEIREGIVEIKGIAREAGARTKMAVYSNNPDVDPVGACVGMNKERVEAVIGELKGEKIDIIRWTDDPGMLIANALSPSTVVSVEVDPELKEAKVIVPSYQLSLAIGKSGQNARLAARLTGYKIDIKGDGNMDADGYYDIPDVDAEANMGEDYIPEENGEDNQ
ncbi:MAG: transcription termination factor NusA [Lachnospiraceae bacterium]|nr:transcription termination factor NusA [Lachnospiraceae bacterium]